MAPSALARSLTAALCLSALVGSASANYYIQEVFYASGCAASDVGKVQALDFDTMASACIISGLGRYSGKWTCQANGKILVNYFTDSSCTVAHSDASTEMDDTCQEVHFSSNGTAMGWGRTRCAATRPEIPGATGTLVIQAEAFIDDTCSTPFDMTALPNMPGMPNAAAMANLLKMEYTVDLGCTDASSFENGAWVSKSELKAFAQGSRGVDGDDVTFRKYDGKGCDNAYFVEQHNVRCGKCQPRTGGNTYDMILTSGGVGYEKATCGSGRGALSFGLSTTPSSYTFLAIATFSAASLFAA